MRLFLAALTTIAIGLLAGRLEPQNKDIPAESESRKAGPKDLREHVRQLKSRAPAGFTVVEQAPFVVIGDEPAATVRARATDTVKWAVDRLKRDFFAKDPDDTIDIWLFKDETSYEKNTQTLFHEKPTTPFGYYSAQHKALIMNIATGGGTLVHEIVHPFMRADFPPCPFKLWQFTQPSARKDDSPCLASPGKVV